MLALMFVLHMADKISAGIAEREVTGAIVQEEN